LRVGNGNWRMVACSITRPLVAFSDCTSGGAAVTSTVCSPALFSFNDALTAVVSVIWTVTPPILETANPLAVISKA